MLKLLPVLITAKQGVALQLLSRTVFARSCQSSLVDVRPALPLEGKAFESAIVGPETQQCCGFSSPLSNPENSAERDQLLENLQEGMEVKGIVKNLTDYGALLISGRR